MHLKNVFHQSYYVAICKQRCFLVPVGLKKNIKTELLRSESFVYFFVDIFFSV